MSPYRKYVEKLLKAKGIRKTIQMQHKETKFLLHRAKIALEKTNPILDADYLSTSGHHDWQGKKFLKVEKIFDWEGKKIFHDWQGKKYLRLAR